MCKSELILKVAEKEKDEKNYRDTFPWSKTCWRLNIELEIRLKVQKDAVKENGNWGLIYILTVCGWYLGFLLRNKRFYHEDGKSQMEEPVYLHFSLHPWPRPWPQR